MIYIPNFSCNFICSSVLYFDNCNNCFFFFWFTEKSRPVCQHCALTAPHPERDEQSFSFYWGKKFIFLANFLSFGINESHSLLLINCFNTVSAWFRCAATAPFICHPICNEWAQVVAVFYHSASRDRLIFLLYSQAFGSYWQVHVNNYNEWHRWGLTHQDQMLMNNMASLFFLQDANQVKVAQENGAVFAGGVELIQPVSLFRSSFLSPENWSLWL